MLTKEMEQLLLSFDDPDLTAAQRGQLDQLLQTNPEAREYHRQLQTLDQQMETLSGDLDKIDFRGFARAVNQRIDAAQARRQPRRILWRLLAPLSAAAAVMMVALPWINPPSTTTLPPTQQSVAQVTLTGPPTIASVEVAQVSISYRQPAAQNVSIVKVAPPSQQPPVNPNFGDRKGEIICFAGPLLRRDPVKPNATPNNNYFVF